MHSSLGINSVVIFSTSLSGTTKPFDSDVFSTGISDLNMPLTAFSLQLCLVLKRSHCFQGSGFLLDRLRRCLKLLVSTESTSCHEFTSQFCIDIFYTRKTPKTIANTASHTQLFI